MLGNVSFNLYLIRHGESEVNARPDEMGQTAGVKLTDKGREQARKLGTHLSKKGISFDRIFSSPYERALRTAYIAMYNYENDDNAGIQTVPELREYEAGDWTGASRSLTLTDTVRQRMNTFNMSFQPPNGEALIQVERRASKWLEDAILFNDTMLDEIFAANQVGIVPNIAIFSHGMTIKCLLHYVMGFDKNFTWRISIENTSVTQLHFDKNGWALDKVNDISHLDGM